MTLLRPLLLALCAGLALAAQAAPAGAPREITFDGERYLSAGVERDESRVAEHFVREIESLARYSRRVTIAEQPKAQSVRQLGLGVVRIAKLRSPGLEPEVYSAEGAEDRDLTVAWIALTDDNAAVEYHATRFVALFDKSGAPKGVREYHYVAREYTNGRHPDQVLASFAPVISGFSDRWVEALQHLDRAPGTGR
jgi:hypothetical protein